MNTSKTSSTSVTDQQIVDLPPPTYAPAAMAMGIAMLAWGLLTHWTMSLAGAGLITWSLGNWIGAIARQWRSLE